MTEQEQVQVIQADRDAAAIVYEALLPHTDWRIVAIVYEALLPHTDWRIVNARLGNMDDLPTVQAFARHRHTATAEALEAMREAREALDQIAGCEFLSMPAEVVSIVRRNTAREALPRLTAAIAKIEGDTK